MKSFTSKPFSLLRAAFVCVASSAPVVAAAADAPFVLEQSVTIPKVPVGPYSDTLTVDPATGRVFATPQAAKAVAVIDPKAGQVLKMIPVGNPHGTYYSPIFKRLFVVDGAEGDLKIFNGEDYSLLKAIPLTKGADSLAHDAHAQMLYLGHGGDAAGLKQAIITLVDEAKMEKVADIPVDSQGLEGFALDSDKQLLYVNLDEDDKAVAVIDLKTRQTVKRWNLPAGPHRAKAIALDASHGRLYVACRDSAMHGSVIVFNVADGQPVATLAIGSWADGMFVDQKRQRLYITTGLGYIESYAIEPNDGYRRLEQVETTILGKTSLYSSDTDRLYVNVPHLGGGSEDAAKILIFKPVS